MKILIVSTVLFTSGCMTHTGEMLDTLKSTCQNGELVVNSVKTWEETKLSFSCGL